MKNGEDPDSLFKWRPHDHFGSRDSGEEAAREATPEEWKLLWYMGWAWCIRNRPLRMTSQDVTDIIGLPQDYGGHPSQVGANTDPTAQRFGLVAKDVKKARGRHQQWNTVWGLPDDEHSGVQVELIL